MNDTSPAPVQPTPTPVQLAWQELEFYAFVHFNMNTFSDMEWGLGDEKPAQFNPTQLDCRQWVRVFKDAGMKAVILTAKHHDGFCLWPSAHTEHSVKNSPWKNGAGDVVGDLASACQEYGLKLGIYLSPWDRNHPEYGQPAYIDCFRAQLRELLSNYGDIFEVWFDGANGGSGYYGGANEERLVDKRSYYDWPETIRLIRQLQPEAIIWSDAGPDARWVGNEHGFSYPTTWSNLDRDQVYGGMPEYAKEYSMGQENGSHWIPAEADVSIRPGWYYHEYEDHKVKSLAQLLDVYYNSVGQNSTLLLNFPVDRSGLVHKNDIRQIQRLSAKLAEDFLHDLAPGNTISATHQRAQGFSAANATDGDKHTYWSTADNTVQASLTIEFDQPTAFNRFMAQEYIALGQRVKKFTLEAKTQTGWQLVAEGTTIGYKRILRLPATTATAVRFTVQDAKACPAMVRLALFNAPKLVEPPKIVRDGAGQVTLSVPEEGVDIFYTLDGSQPTPTSTAYQGPFLQAQPAIIQALAIDAATNRSSETSSSALDVAPLKWQVMHSDPKAARVLDGNPDTYWANDNADNQLSIDLGETLDLRGFCYLPMQERWVSGLITQYAFYTSLDHAEWILATAGEFGNIVNSPILQQIPFAPVTARYIRLQAVATADSKAASFARISVLTR
jgi:alpha-L-fucosidase